MGTPARQQAYKAERVHAQLKALSHKREHTIELKPAAVLQSNTHRPKACIMVHLQRHVLCPRLVRMLTLVQDYSALQKPANKVTCTSDQPPPHPSHTHIPQTDTACLHAHMHSHTHTDVCCLARLSVMPIMLSHVCKKTQMRTLLHAPEREGAGRLQRDLIERD